MSAAWQFARSAARVYRASLVGSFVVVALAAALLTATGVLLESGLRAPAPLLTTLASSFAGTTVLVVVLVVGSTFAAGLRERRRQWALLRAVGATGAQVRGLITAEVALLFAVAAPSGALPGLLAARPLVPLLEAGGVVEPGFALVVSPAPALAAVLILAPTALLAARVAAREAVRSSPTTAVRSAAVEAPGLSTVRRLAALWTAGAGLAVSVVPFVFPGTLGAATGAISALLLIAAAALAGPALVGGAARWAEALTAGRGAPAGVLAVANARGHSRRLTTGVVPLALLLALGTVQTGVGATLTTAAGAQLEEGIRADLVVLAPEGVTPAQASAVGRLDGVTAAAATGSVRAEVKVDSGDEELAFLDALVWETSSLRVLAPSAEGVLDVDVASGSLAGLAAPGTIAVSTEATIGTVKRVGDSVQARRSDGTELTLEIVAVYRRGLGFGDFLVGEELAALLAPGSAAPHDAVFLQVADGVAGQVRAQVGALGLEVVDAAGYVEEATTAGAAQQRLSSALLLVLLLFLAVACVNTLAILTGQRRREFALLRRTGATRGQLLAMVGVESLFVSTSALVIGTLAVVPALVGVSFGLLGTFTPGVDWAVFRVLAGAVLAMAVVTLFAAGSRVAARSR